MYYFILESKLNLAYGDYANINQILFQDSASLHMEGLISFHHDLLCFLLMIGFLISYLLLTCCVYFLSNKTIPSSNSISHNSSLENMWTVIPLLIVFIIGGTSSSLLLSLESFYYASMTLKVVGSQWFWFYEYSDNFHKTLGNTNIVSFESYLIEETLPLVTNGGLRLLEVDMLIKLPVYIVIRVLTTSLDVLHSWAIPSLGVKVDSCPGRLNQFLLVINRESRFYGQCSELCGIKHGYMPIVVESTNIQEFYKWVIIKTSFVNEKSTYYTK